MNLKENGDAIEKKYHDFIKNSLPTYSTIWEKFISKINRVENENNDCDELKSQKRLAQLLYSCIYGTIAMKRVKEKYSTINQVPKRNDSDQFIDTIYESLNDLMLFQVHIGRTSEIVRKEIPSIIKGIKGKELLSKYFQSRNNLIHSQRIPVSIKEGGKVLIPKFAAQIESDGWSHKEGNEFKIWEDISEKDFQDLSHYFNSFFNDFVSDLEVAFKIILDKIPEKWKTKDVFNKENLLEENIYEAVLISGDTQNIFYESINLTSKSQKKINKNIKR